MAKDKSLGSNPALAFHKKTKKDSINKSRIEKSRLRDSQLQKRRPDQVERQIDDLRQLAQSGKINAQDRRNLESLERDLARMNKLRAEGKTGPLVTSERTKRRDEKLEIRQAKIPKNPTRSYYYDPIYNPYGVPPPGMPYREIDSEDEAHDSDGSTSASVADIPMPEGTPPPIADHRIQREHSSPRNEYKEREKHIPRQGGRMMQDKNSEQQDQEHEPKAEAVSRTTYSSAPVMRDLRQEAIAFKPKNLKKPTVDPFRAKQIDPLDLEAMEVQEAQTEQARPVKKRINIAP